MLVALIIASTFVIVDEVRIAHEQHALELVPSCELQWLQGIRPEWRCQR